MDAGSAAANTMDAGTAPVAGDKSTGEEPKKDAAAAGTTEKPKADAAAPAKVELYSPILDADVEIIGVSNKGHKKTINVIQVLYGKSSTNAMM